MLFPSKLAESAHRFLPSWEGQGNLCTGSRKLSTTDCAYLRVLSSELIDVNQSLLENVLPLVLILTLGIILTSTLSMSMPYAPRRVAINFSHSCSWLMGISRAPLPRALRQLGFPYP